MKVEVYIKGGGNVSFQSVKRHKMANRRHFVAVKKSRKRSGFVLYSYLKDSAFTAVKRDAKF